MPQNPARDAVSTGIFVKVELGSGVSEQMRVSRQPGMGQHRSLDLIGERIDMFGVAHSMKSLLSGAEQTLTFEDGCFRFCPQRTLAFVTSPNRFMGTWPN